MTDMVFDALYQRIIVLDLPPCTKLSVADVANQMGVSRQPVRDAFFRLSQLGFLLVRPQRATTVTPISQASVLQAKFIRTAIELETIRLAAQQLASRDLDPLRALLVEQDKAVCADDRPSFHRLDDAFHKEICDLTGHDFAWLLIRESKAHMDRVRYLSLPGGAAIALDDHRRILAALEIGDADAATRCMRVHLSRIEGKLGQIRMEHGEYFDGEPIGNAGQTE